MWVCQQSMGVGIAVFGLVRFYPRELLITLTVGRVEEVAMRSVTNVMLGEPGQPQGSPYLQPFRMNPQGLLQSVSPDLVGLDLGGA